MWIWWKILYKWGVAVVESVTSLIRLYPFCLIPFRLIPFGLQICPISSDTS